MAPDPKMAAARLLSADSIRYQARPSNAALRTASITATPETSWTIAVSATAIRMTAAIRDPQPHPIATLPLAASFERRRHARRARRRRHRAVARGAVIGVKPVRAMLRASSTEVMPRPLEP
ncbi:hypothetical protein CTI14_28065 [Methylobacterium radiotolerans]|nr:hypothetical protein CTI14_28065 [Methylobacterium radiotolerans]